MRSFRRLAAATLGAWAMLLVTAGTASAQSEINPTVTPVLNKGDWTYGASVLLAGLGGAITIALGIAFMARSPRFARDEETLKVVRADRVLPGRDLPRRAVDVSQAATVLVAPPAIPGAQPVAVAAPAAAAPAAAPAPAATAPAPAPAAAAPAVAPAPAAAAPAQAEAPAETPAAAPAPAAAAPAPEATAPAPAAASHAEVSLDQEVFDSTLAELLAKGTDRRVAEGQAKRAAMIAARKKAEG